MKVYLKKIFHNKHEAIWLGLVAVFYLSLFAIYGAELCDDSNGYINMVSAREPIYPLFLAVNRLIFGEKIYLEFVAFWQNILMIFALWNLIVYLYRRFSFTAIYGYLMILVNMGVAALCQFVALRGALYSNSIETEGLSIPIWIIFITILLKAIDNKKISYVFFLCLLTAINMDIRKQMLMGFAVMFAVLFFAYWGLKDYIKRIFIMIVAIVLAFILALTITRVYNYCLRGSFAQNTRDMNLILTTSLYVASSEDAYLIDEESTRNLFVKTMDILEKEKITFKYAGESLAELNQHYGDSFDKITINTTAHMFVDYAIEQGFSEGMEAEAEADRMSAVIVKSLIKDNIAGYIKVYVSSVYDGLINTIAKRHPLLDIYSMFAYLIYILSMVLMLVKKELRAVGMVALTVLMAVLVNVCMTAAVIFCQTRYMIYNMPLVYMTALLMISQIKRDKNTAIGNQ